MANTNYTILIQQSATANPIVVEAPIPDEFAFDVGASYETPLPQGFTSNKLINLGASIVGSRLAVQAMSAQLWAGNTDTELSVEVVFHTESDPVTDVRTPIVNLLKLTMPSISTSTGLLTSPGPSFDASFAASVAGDTLKTLGNDASAVLGGIQNAYSNFISGILGTPSTTGSMTNTNTQTNDGANNTIPASITQNPNLGTASYWNTKIKNKISIRVGNYLYFDSVVITRVAITAASNFDAQTGLPHSARVAIAFKPLFMLVQQDLDTLFINPNSNNSPSTSLFGVSTPVAGPSTNSFGVGSNTAGFTL